MNRLIVRADGNGNIGSGHIMRCSAIAVEARSVGCEVIFAVSDDDSRELVESLGFRCAVVGGDYSSFDARDADALADFAGNLGAGAVLIDSYAVTDGFFGRLAARGIACAYIDDAYTFEGGFAETPVRRDVAAVINYSFGFDLADYDVVYGETSTALHIGPEYAPVREAFRGVTYAVRPEVGSVLVTSGMTNPDRALERMASGCRAALPNAHITVVVGSSASFDESSLTGTDFEAVHDVRNMHELMARADLAVAAAGSTLYELACVGIPTVALPVVENQLANVRGFAAMGLGLTMGNLSWTPSKVAMLLGELAHDPNRRRILSVAMRGQVDGLGASRIAFLIAGIAGNVR